MKNNRPFINDIWSPEQVQAGWDRFESCKTFADWEYLQENEKKLYSSSISYHPVDYSKVDSPITKKDYRFQKIAECNSINFEELLEKVTREQSNAEFKEDRVSGERKSFDSDLEFLKSVGFATTEEVKVVKVTEELFPELTNIVDQFDLDYCNTQLRYNLIGSMLHLHTDSCFGAWRNLEQLRDLPFNHVTKSPEGYYMFRILIPLEDWQPGHVVGFEEEMWTWKAGDALVFDWANLKHYTCNLSFKSRYQFRITGVTTNPNHWLFDHINNDKVKSL